MALLDDLQNPIDTLDNFKSITYRILNYIPEVISSKNENKDYIIIKSLQGSTQKYARPYNKNLFIFDPEIFLQEYSEFILILEKVRNKDINFTEYEFEITDKITYTIQQSIGIALDLLGNQNANRKHVGNRFEELIRILVLSIGIKNKKVVLKIPYESNRIYSCETDFVFSPYDDVKSNNKSIDKNEIVVSLKTSSKDRLGKIFIDKLLMTRFVGNDVKVIGIFLNDIQRKENDKVSYTFVAGLFMVYTKFLTNLNGIYFIDPPENVKKEPYNKYIKRFSQFLLIDVNKMLVPSS